MPIIQYKNLCLCFNRLVLYWTFCQSLLRFESKNEEKPNCTKLLLCKGITHVKLEDFEHKQSKVKRSSGLKMGTPKLLFWLIPSEMTVVFHIFILHDENTNLSEIRVKVY